MSGEGGEGEGEGKLPSVDHGRRTDEGRDKNRGRNFGRYFHSWPLWLAQGAMLVLLKSLANGLKV